MVEIGKRRNVSKDIRKLEDLKRETGRKREKEGEEKREQDRRIG